MAPGHVPEMVFASSQTALLYPRTMLIVGITDIESGKMPLCTYTLTACDDRSLAMNNKLPAELLALREKFTMTLPERSRQINELWSILRHQAWSDAGVHALQMLAHRLSGSCATFGYPKMGDAARALEQFIQHRREQGLDFGGIERERLQTLVSQLIAALLERGDEKPPEAWQTAELTTPPTTESATVFIVDDDQVLANLLATYLQRAGYQCESFTTPSDCIHRLTEQRADLIIMDLGFPEAPLLGIDAIQSIRELTGGQTPIMLMSARTDLAARLQALRAGAENFIHKPVDFSELLKAVQHSIDRTMPPLKVLIVDDDELITSVLETSLQQAGMQPLVVNQPMNTLQKAAQFKPDVIMLDMHMPKVNGFELAALIRQDPAFSLMPIVFLTSDTSVDLKRSVRALGVSAFLTKPIEPRKLVEVLKQAHHNTRQLKRRIERVTKTEKSSLLTRSYFFDALQRQLADEQHERRMSLIYLGVDDLDKLQQHYGYAGMAQLHEQFVQRIADNQASGEQWTIIANLVACAMINSAEEKTLLNRAEQLLSSFKQHPLRAGGQELSATISIGIVPLKQAPGSVNAAMAVVEQQYELARQHQTNRVMLRQQQVAPEGIVFDPQQDLPVDRLSLAFQPIVDIETHAANHFDVLVRYRDQHDNLIPAGRFIRLLTDADKRMELDRWVLQSAIKSLEADTLTRESGTLFVHLSEDSLRQKLFLSFIANVLRSSRIRGDKRLIIMLDAQWVSLHQDYAAFVVKALRDARCGVCLIKLALEAPFIQMINSLKPDFIKLANNIPSQLANKSLSVSAIEPLTQACSEAGSQLIVTHVEESATLASLWQKGIRLFQGYFIQAPGIDFSRKEAG